MADHKNQPATSVAMPCTSTAIERRHYMRLLKRVALRRYSNRRELQMRAAAGAGPDMRALAIRAPY